MAIHLVEPWRATLVSTEPEFQNSILGFLDLPFSSSAFPLFAAFPNSRRATVSRKLDPVKRIHAATGDPREMQPARTVVRHGTVAILLTLACLWAATQWAASMLAYQPALGPPLVDLAVLKLYAPWQLFTWWLAFDTQAPHVFAAAGAVAALG